MEVIDFTLAVFQGDKLLLKEKAPENIPDSCSKRFTSDQIAAMQATLLARKPQWLGLTKKPS
jgi:hypothetical protein